MRGRLSLVSMFAMIPLISTGLCGCEALGLTGGEVEEVGALVTVAPVNEGYLERSLELTGTIEAGQSVKLVPDMPGKVKSLPVQVGSEVNRGDLLARLDTDMARLQAEQAQAAVRLGELGLETAEREFARAERLHASGSLTEQQFDQAQAGFEMAEQQLAQASAMHGLANEQVSGGVLRAPFAGVVTSVGCEEGEYFNTMGMSPTGGSPVLVSVVNLDTIRVDVQASDRDVGRLAEGMSARIYVDSLADQLPADGLEGRVEFVGLAADPMTRTFPVRVVADNPDQTVRAGMHARIRLVLERRDSAMYVADEAVRESEGQSYVMVAQDTVARRRPVTTGLVGDQGTEITKGLAAGELVVVAGNFGLPDEALIEVTQ